MFTDRQGNVRNDNGTLTAGNNANPTGKGGFGDRPEDINRNGRPTNRGSMTGSLRKFMQMNRRELNELIAAATHGDIELTEAEHQALQQVIDGRTMHQAREQIMDRLDGKPRLTVDASVALPEPPNINITFA